MEKKKHHAWERWHLNAPKCRWYKNSYIGQGVEMGWIMIGLIIGGFLIGIGCECGLNKIAKAIREYDD